ncbi:MAG TPA: hypothetical protein VF604_11520 [Pyrinomonadaceae bacterium]
MKNLLLMPVAFCFIAFIAATANFAAPGSLDTTFRGTGFHRSGFGFGADGAGKVLIQADGKIITVGGIENGENGSTLIARYGTNGSLDPTFGEGGFVTTGNFGVGDAELQPDGKILIGGSIGTGNGTRDFIITRYNSDGTRDLNFGNQGITTTDFNGQYDTGWDVALQPDGKIVLAGGAQIGSGDGFAVARYNPDGSPDASFGNGGKKTTIVSGDQESGYAVAVQPDGKIVVAGATILNGFCFAVVRYLPNGDLDTSFDNDGIVVTNTSNNVGEPSSIAIQTDGKIVIGGDDINIVLIRYNPNGSLDTTFGGTGIVRTIIRALETCNELKLQTDGKIVVVGTSYLSSSVLNFTVLRYNANGALDSTFGTNGVVFTEFDNNHEIAHTVAIQGDGKIVAAGTDNQRQYDTILARYNTDGSLDAGFDGDGKASYDFGSDSGESNAVITQPDGKIIIAGFANDFTRSYFAVARYHQNGRLDTSFGGTGRVVTPIGQGTNSAARSIALQADGKIVVAGSAYINDSRLFDFVAVRYNSDGSLDTGFDGDGIAAIDVTLNSVSASDTAYSVEVQTDGKIVLGGTTGGSGTFTDSALVRCNPDGSLDTTFNKTGKVILRQPDYQGIRAIKIQPDGKIAVVGNTGRFSSFDGDTFINDDFLVMRFNSNGMLDATFDADGIAVVIWSAFPDTAVDIALQPDGKIIAAGNYSRSLNRFNPALVRFNVDGSLDLSFGTGGKVTTLIETDSLTQAVIVQSDGKIVVGGAAYDQLFRRDLLLVRYNDDGSLNANFGTGGIARTDILGSTVEVIRDLATDSFGRIVAAGSTNGLSFAARFNGDVSSPARLTGRVTNANGQGIFGVTVRLSGTALTAPMLARTNNFGYYTFTDAPLGNGYSVSVNSKRYTFAAPSRTVDLGGDVANIDFVSEE